MRVVWAAAFTFLLAVSAAAQSADLFVTKTAPATATVGSNITFTVTVGNNGPDDAAFANLDDTLPAGVTFQSYNQTTGPTFNCTAPPVNSTGSFTCSIATLPAGAGGTAQFDIVVKVSPGTEGTTLINMATVSSETPDDNDENNTAVSGTDVAGGNLADVRILKTGPVSQPANTDVTYTITVVNDGPNDATNVTFTDTLPNSIPPSSPLTFVSFNQNSGPTFNCGNPGATTTCTIKTFPNGSTATFTLVAHIPAGVTSGHTYTNVVNMTSDNDPNPDNDTSSTTVTISSVDVGVVKSGPTTAVAGGPAYDYIIMVSNGGPDAATDVTFSDTLPAGLTLVSVTQNTGPAANCSDGPPVACTIPLLGNGQSAQFTITVQPQSTIPNGTVLSNTATVTTSSFDSNANNNSSSVNTTVSASADVAVVKSGPATAVNGTDVTYNITVTNNGPSTAANVVMTEGNPPNTTFVSATQNSGPAFNCSTNGTTGITTCSIASLAPGAAATFTIVIHLPSSGGTTFMSNTANVSTSTPDPNSSNNSSVVPTTVSSRADLGVVKSAPSAATAGSNVTYTITVTNAGPTDATNATMTDTLPAGTTFVSENQTSGPTFNCTTGATVTCTIASFPSGATAVFSVVVAFSGSIANGTTVTNTANVTSATPDTNATNNSSSASTLVSANADLSVNKSGPPTTLSNTNLTYTVVAANAGPSNAASVTLTDTLPAGTTFVSVNQTTGPAFNCSGSGPVVCTIASFAAGASATFQITVAVPQSIASGTTITNTATIASTTPDSNATNNTSSASTLVGATIPTLSPLAMALMAMALALIGWMTARR